MTIYPNPVYEVLNVKNAEKYINASFNIVNVLGQTVQQSKVLKNNSIDISCLSPGL
jgi:hypothetical protein